jgi:hypothetical protein
MPEDDVWLDALLSKKRCRSERDCRESGLKVLRLQKRASTAFRQREKFFACRFTGTFPERQRRRIRASKVDSHPRMFGALPCDYPGDHADIPPSTTTAWPVM